VCGILNSPGEREQGRLIKIPTVRPKKEEREKLKIISASYPRDSDPTHTETRGVNGGLGKRRQALRGDINPARGVVLSIGETAKGPSKLRGGEREKEVRKSRRP